MDVAGKAREDHTFRTDIPKDFPCDSGNDDGLYVLCQRIYLGIEGNKTILQVTQDQEMILGLAKKISE